MKGIAAGILMAAVCSAAPQQDGKAVMERVCTKCHALTATLAQHNTRDRWSQIVDDMVARGAEVTDAEVDIIIDYLAKTQGLKTNVNKANADELARALDVPTATAAAVVQYRRTHGAFKDFEDLKKAPPLAGRDIESKKEAIEFGM
jgi:competence ComEA-like helix-hairpin-helix protein